MFLKLKRQGADLQIKIEELRIINQSLRENDKVKEDALAHLSDQLLVFSEEYNNWKENKSIEIIYGSVNLAASSFLSC